MQLTLPWEREPDHKAAQTPKPVVRQQRAQRGAVAYASGKAAEEAALRHFEKKGLTLAERRWRGQGGEIDLVLRQGAEVVFVEVKKARDFGTALARISARQITRIFAAATEFVGNEPLGQLTPIRIDVALVNERGEVKVMENAFAGY